MFHKKSPISVALLIELKKNQKLFRNRSDVAFFPDSTKAASSFASLAGLNTFPAAEPLPTLKFSKNHRNSFPGKEVPKTRKKIFYFTVRN